MTVASAEARLQTSAHLKVVPRPSDYALYHGVYGGLFLANRQAIDLLRLFEQPTAIREAVRAANLSDLPAEALIQYLELKRLLVPEDFDEQTIVADRQTQRERDLVSGRQIRAVQLIVTNRCNFRCQYCFEGLGATPPAQTVYGRSSRERSDAQHDRANAVMHPAEAEAYLHAVIDMAKRAGNSLLAVQFFGGEPLLNWRTVHHVLQHFGNSTDGVALSYSVVTNGSTITDEMARTFREHEVPVIVSYDSPGADARPFAGGRKSHDTIRRGIDLLARQGNRVALNAALTNSTFDLFDRDLVDFAVNHGVYEIGVVLDLDPSFYETREAAAIADKLWDVCLYGRSRGVVLTGYWHQIFQGLAADDRYGAIGYQNCSAMGVQLSIEPSGAVFACKASGGYFGHILDMEEMLSSEIYRRYAMRACRNPDSCLGCDIDRFCGGLCLGAIENRYGDIQAVESSACGVYRELTRRLILGATNRQVPALITSAV